VLGREAAAVQTALEREIPTPISFIQNPDFASGMGSSVRIGIQTLQHTQTEAVLVVLGDQPRVPDIVFTTLLEAYAQTQTQIITPIFAGVRGHPVLFARAVWPELVQLRGDSGGKAVIEKDAARVLKLEFDFPVPKDVDTLKDLQELENPSSD
jgi:molybdenum cofactor cytidylyltransferase